MNRNLTTSGSQADSAGSIPVFTVLFALIRDEFLHSRVADSLQFDWFQDYSRLGIQTARRWATTVLSLRAINCAVNHPSKARWQQPWRAPRTRNPRRAQVSG